MSLRTANKHFDKTYVITSRNPFTRRPELKSQLDGMDYEAFTEYNGEELPPPSWWKNTKGAWGCLNSHSLIWNELWRSDMESVLIFEDDSILVDDFDQRLDELMEDVPTEWDQLYLGGQHRKFAGMIGPRVIKPVSVNRTHCYALKRSAVPKLLQWAWEVHGYMKNFIPFDTQIEKGQKRNEWNIFAPSWWLVGQGANHSVITGKDYEERWWDADFGYSESLPFIWSNSEDPRLHATWEIEDAQLRNASAFKNRLLKMRRGAFYRRMLPAVYGSEKARDMVRRVIGHDSVREESELDELIKYPKNRIFNHPWIS